MTPEQQATAQPPAIIGYLRAAAGDPPFVLDEQKRLFAGSEYRPARAFIDKGDMPGQPRLKACLASLAAGDVLVVTHGHRLAHSVDALLAVEASLHKRGVGLVLLSFNGAPVDFRKDEAKLVLDLLSEIAAWEYHGLRERQRAGIGAAKAAGRYRGRSPSIRPADVLERLRRGAKPAAVAADLGIARSSVYRVAQGHVGCPNRVELAGTGTVSV